MWGIKVQVQLGLKISITSRHKIPERMANEDDRHGDTPQVSTHLYSCMIPSTASMQRFGRKG